MARAPILQCPCGSFIVPGDELGYITSGIFAGIDLEGNIRFAYETPQPVHLCATCRVAVGRRLEELVAEPEQDEDETVTVTTATECSPNASCSGAVCCGRL